ncbi:hypothetical protein MBLNU459_g3210t1 [Dothideomycetes sp. NU459]
MDSTAVKVQSLGDLELAVLLSLVAEQHCIIAADNRLLGDLAQELILIGKKVFGLTSALIDCSSTTTLDDFREGALVDTADESDDAMERTPHQNPFPAVSRSSGRQNVFRNESGMSNSLDERRVANIVIAKNLNLASHNVQTQALELIRTRRLFTHTAMHGTSKEFLLIALQSSGSSTRFNIHLNDMFSFSHRHCDEDGFPNTKEGADRRSLLDDAASMSSVLQTPYLGHNRELRTPVVTRTELDQLRSAAKEARLSAEVSAHMHNIVIFMRLNRFVAGGVSALATRQLRTLVKALAPLHNLSYVPPSLVALAVRKVYPHRLVLATWKTERSLQWGSDLQAVEDLLDGVTVDDAIDSVLSSVEAPL